MSGVNGDGERGALGVAAAPGWPKPQTLYVYATRSTGNGLMNQILKITRSNGHVHMRVLMSQPASSEPYHNGGRILFGPDGMLYAIVGDGHDSTNAQDLAGNLRGKILRMNADGASAAGQPDRGQPRLRVRHPQLVRVHVRPADRAACGRPRTAPNATTRST